MAYVVKWLDQGGQTRQSAPQASPSDALRFSRTLAALRPRAIWAESDSGLRFQITSGRTDEASRAGQPQPAGLTA